MSISEPMARNMTRVAWVRFDTDKKRDAAINIINTLTIGDESF